MCFEDTDDNIKEQITCLLNDENTYFASSQAESIEELIFFWRIFSKRMDIESANQFASKFVHLLGEHIFSQNYTSKSKIKRFYTHHENPFIVYLHILYLKFNLKNFSGPISCTYLLSILFGDGNTEFSKFLYRIHVFEIQNMLLLLSSYYLNINWSYVCRLMPGISKFYSNDSHFVQSNRRGNGASNIREIDSNLPSYSIHLSSFWILRDSIYIVLSLIYFSRNKNLNDFIIDNYCGLLKDLTYQKTLLLTGPKISNNNKRLPSLLKLKERSCITSAIPLLDVLMQFLLNSNEKEIVINEIISRISNEHLVDSGIYLKDTNFNNSEHNLGICIANPQFGITLRASYKFPNYNTCIDILLKGGEFLFVYPKPNFFDRLIRKIKDNTFNVGMDSISNKNIGENRLSTLLEEFFPKIILRLSKDFKYLIIEEISSETEKNLKNSFTIVDRRKEIRSIFKRRPKKKKIPVENIVSTNIGYPSKPESIPMPSPGVIRSCFCCFQNEFDDTLLFYRTLNIQTKKRCFKFLSVKVKDLCVKQWHAIIRQFIDLKFYQISTNNTISKSLIKITKNKKYNKINSLQLNLYKITEKWYEEVLAKWEIHWNCNSIPVSVHNLSLNANQHINKNRNESGYTKQNFGKYLKNISQTSQLDNFNLWFFGSHLLNQNTSMHIFVNKPKLTALKSLQNLKGYSIENICPIEYGSSVSNWINFLQYKLYSSYPLHTFPIIDRGVRFGAPNSQLLSDLWSFGIPSNLRTKIWEIALGNDLKVSNELFKILNLQSKLNIEKNGNCLMNSLIFRYALEIQYIFYNKRRNSDIGKKLSPYIERKVEILNSSASLYYPYFFSQRCGFAKEFDYSTFKYEETYNSTPLINTDEYFIDINSVHISKKIIKTDSLENEFFTERNDFEQLYNSNDAQFINDFNANRVPNLDFSSFEALTLTRFIQYHEVSKTHDSFFQENIDLSKRNCDHGNSSSITIIKGLLDTIGALILHIPNIGFQPCIINYLSVFLMYMDPPSAFKCMLNLINSFDVLFISNDLTSLNAFDSFERCSLGLLSESSTESFLLNSQYYNQFLYSNDNIWILFSHIFQSFVYSKLPQLYQHLLYTIGISFENIVIPWFRHIFMDTLSLPVVLVIWDNFLLIGLPLLFQAGLSLLKLCEPQILKCERIIDALNLLLNNCDYNSFVIKPDSFAATLREMQKVCDITEITSIVSQYKLIEQKRWILRSQQAVRNYLLSQGYYCTSTPNTPKGR
ncbi:TBC domain-containing protein [Cryptosporidium ubiquitum]|uniref:TBC domain-containing protein n=1 Tax=Cryptosporidium ubiquitum TaxID=857276 RepID=A0A1J4MFY8_9CRYT|nr:TBC domain-containing protein [Cryptosporidium ubiquitum]OII71757.1 TBC domain-containing protein [Cryptosporidium ubiquitum]